MTADDRNTVATKAPRGLCPRCERDVALRRGGELREHTVAGTVQSAQCPGSGLKAEVLTDAELERHQVAAHRQRLGHVR